MITITLQREKCIGCNYCTDEAPNHFVMSKKDGKTTLLNSRDRKGFHTYKEANHMHQMELEKAEKICPVKIIKVK